MIDIANALSGRNLNTSLIAGRLVVRNKQLDDSVRVRKIIKYFRSNKMKRLFSWIIAFFEIIIIIKTKYRNDYLLIITNPPFTTFIPFLCPNRFSLMIFDVYPDAVTQTGLLAENSILVRYWQKANKKVFPRADNIFTLSESMALRLREYCNTKKIKITPIWSDNEFFKSIKKSLNPFVSEYNLSERFVVLYSGNLGSTHNVEIIPELASCTENPDVIFVIIGDGDRRNWLDEAIRKRELKNCLLLPLQAVDKIPYSFASADLAIVSLGTMASGLSLPSKTFNFMSAGLPLLCIAGIDSELYQLVTKYENGKCFIPDQIGEIVTFIQEMSDNQELCALYRANSLKASRDFTPRNAELIAEAICNSIETN